MGKSKQLSLRFPPDLHASVKEAARARRISFNEFVMEAVRLAVERVDVPLAVVTDDDGSIGYVIPIPPEWYAGLRDMAATNSTLTLPPPPEEGDGNDA